MKFRDHSLDLWVVEVSRGPQVPCPEKNIYSGKPVTESLPIHPHQFLLIRFCFTKQSYLLSDGLPYLSTKLRVESWRWVWCDLWSKDAFSGRIQPNYFCHKNWASFLCVVLRWSQKMVTFQYGSIKMNALSWSPSFKMKPAGWPASWKPFQIFQSHPNY